MTVHVLYRMFAEDGHLLYVGLTTNPPARFKHHRFNKSWWDQVAFITVRTYPSKQAVRKAEQAAIRDERPLYNVHNNKANLREQQAVQQREDEALELCQCDSCDIPGECDECDACSDRFEGAYELVEYGPEPEVTPEERREQEEAAQAIAAYMDRVIA